MKISLIGPVYPYRGGIAHQTTQLKENLDRLGHESSVISFHRQYPGFLYKGASDKDPSYHADIVEAAYLLDFLRPSTWKQAARMITENTPDIVLIQWWTTFWSIPFAVIARYLKAKGIPVNFLIHNVLPHEQRFWDPWLAKIALRQGASFITQSPDETQRLRSLIPNAKIYECKLPVYRMFSKEKIDREKARESLQISADELMLLSFGIVRPYKGIPNVISALGTLRDWGHTPYYFIVGEFWTDELSYRSLALKNSVSDQIRIINRYIRDEEVVLYFSAADVLVAVYTAGTQSAAVTVGIDFDIPILTTPKIAAGIDPAYAAQVIQVPPDDVKAIAQALLSMYNSLPKAPGKMEDPPRDWDELIGLIEKIVAETS